MKSATRILSLVGFAGATLLGSACGQGGSTPSSAGDPNQSAADALTVIQNCQTQARGCFEGGDDSKCDDGLRSCLERGLPDGGTPSGHADGNEHDDASGQDNESQGDKSQDGGKSKDDDGSQGDDASGHARTLPEAAVAALTKPREREGGPPALVCVDALHACLASQTRPMDCADAASACLKGGLDDGGP